MSSASLFTLRVAAKSFEAEGVASFHLVDAAGGALPGFEAGAHIDVEAGAGILRQYSLCNPAVSPTHYEIAVLNEPTSRGGSRFMHETLTVGATLQASAPRNHFALVEQAPALLFAGGIGITPVLAMAQELTAQGREFELHYCARSRNRAAFASRLEQADFADRVHLHLDDGAPEQKLQALRVLQQAGTDTHLYVCGPGGFIQHVLDAAAQAGWDSARVHREFFSAPASAPATAAETPFELEIASTGLKLLVPVGKSALAVLQDAGLDVPASCETGVCGTCLTRVLTGTPDHRDVYLTDEEHAANDCFTPCCSRACTQRLVLDL